ncbi:MAG: RimK/LysX family protein [Thermodesulfobacteriota bacterium]
MRDISRVITVLALLLCVAGEADAQKQVVGWVERAIVYPGNLTLQAKVDTGADNTSIDAAQITEIVRDGRKILRFQVSDRQGQSIQVEREQVGIEVVPRHYGEHEERPLVIMELCLGSECRQTLVNLADRSRLDYPLLIGRSFLLDRVVVNPGAQFLVEPKGPVPK